AAAAARGGRRVLAVVALALGDALADVGVGVVLLGDDVDGLDARARVVGVRDVAVAFGEVEVLVPRGARVVAAAFDALEGLGDALQAAGLPARVGARRREARGLAEVLDRLLHRALHAGRLAEVVEDGRVARIARGGLLERRRG